jgi:hypothetical protein
VDFLTRKGEERKTVGDWLRDKTISLKAWRRLLQTNAGTFPLLGGRPALGTTGHLQISVCRLQTPVTTGITTPVSSRYRMT